MNINFIFGQPNDPNITQIARQFIKLITTYPIDRLLNVTKGETQADIPFEFVDDRQKKLNAIHRTIEQNQNLIEQAQKVAKNLLSENITQKQTSAISQTKEAPVSPENPFDAISMTEGSEYYEIIQS